MRKMMSLFLCCLFLLGLGACNKDTNKGTQNASNDSGGVVNDNYGDWIDDIGD